MEHRRQNKNLACLRNCRVKDLMCSVNAAARVVLQKTFVKY